MEKPLHLQRPTARATSRCTGCSCATSASPSSGGTTSFLRGLATRAIGGCRADPISSTRSLSDYPIAVLARLSTPRGDDTAADRLGQQRSCRILRTRARPGNHGPTPRSGESVPAPALPARRSGHGDLRVSAWRVSLLAERKGGDAGRIVSKLVNRIREDWRPALARALRQLLPAPGRGRQQDYEGQAINHSMKALIDWP